MLKSSLISHTTPHKPLTCRSRAGSNLNLRHGVSSRRVVPAALSPNTYSSDAVVDGKKLPAVLAAVACSFLMPSSAAHAAVGLSSTHLAAAKAPLVHQQQPPSLPAALQDYTPSAAPPVKAITTLQEQQYASAQQLQDIQRLQQPARIAGQEQQQAVLRQQAQQQPPQELQQLAQRDDPRIHWLLVVLGIGVVNIVGLQAVLKLLQASRDSSTPMTVLVCRMGLRADGTKLQERLHFLRDMMGVEHAIFFTFEEAMQAICQPPRGCQLAYADLVVTPLGSKQAGYDVFKQRAKAEQVRAQQEEGARVLKDTRPEGPHHRNMLEKLLGAAETQDAESAQACLLVTLVVLAKGTVDLPAQPLRNQAAFKDTMKSLCGHLKLGQLLAVELLMTPDSPQDFLSEAQLMTDYPFLTDLSSGLRVDHPDWSAAPSPLASGDDLAGAPQYTANSAAAAAMAAMVADASGAEGAASAAAAAAAAAAVQAEERGV